MSKIVVIVLTYRCSFNCDYCILRDKKISREVMDLQVLEDRLLKMKSWADSIVFMGGEISDLPEEYVSKAISLAKGFGFNVTIVSNLNRILDSFLDEDIGLEVSLHLESKSVEKTIENLYQVSRPHLLSVVLTEEIYKRFSPEKLLKIFLTDKSAERYRLSYCLPENSELEKVTYGQYLSFFKEMKDALGEKYDAGILEGPTPVNSFVDIIPDGRYSSLDGHAYGQLGRISFETPEECYKFGLSFNKNDKCLSCNLFSKCTKEYSEECEQTGEIQW